MIAMSVRRALEFRLKTVRLSAPASSQGE